MSFNIEVLTRYHHRAGFDCGEPALNRFLQQHARQNQDRNIGRTYVATRAEESRVLGFHTLSASAVEFARWPEDARRRLPQYPVPVVHLGRLAVDLTVRGQGLGEVLLRDALTRALAVAEVIGIYGVEVYAKHETARAFYSQYGFTEFPDNRLNLYLPTVTIREMLSR